MSKPSTDYTAVTHWVAIDLEMWEQISTDVTEVGLAVSSSWGAYGLALVAEELAVQMAIIIAYLPNEGWK